MFKTRQGNFTMWPALPAPASKARTSRLHHRARWYLAERLSRRPERTNTSSTTVPSLPANCLTRSGHSQQQRLWWRSGTPPISTTHCSASRAFRLFTCRSPRRRWKGWDGRAAFWFQLSAPHLAKAPRWAIHFTGPSIAAPMQRLAQNIIPAADGHCMTVSGCARAIHRM